MPVGFKNGFCVIDLECDGGGTPKYGCGNMGISSGCGDFYSSGLQCQWIDVTDLPEGEYTFITTVNWDQSPDALGNHELRYDNNWAQVCFNLTRNFNTHHIELLTPCETVVDCAGTPFGNAVEDCMGTCGGPNLYGDLNGDFQQSPADAENYVYDIINGGLEAHPCFDLNNDGAISVFDATLVNDCYLYGSQHSHVGGGNIHNHCNLPGGIINPTHSASLKILDYDPSNNTVDIGINNPQDHINAYEFNMSGIEIVSVISLVDPAIYPENPQYQVGGNKVVCISLPDSIIPKTNGSYQPLCRIQFEPTDEEQICIDTIIDLVNGDKHKIQGEIEAGCVSVISNALEISASHNVNVFPNPGNGFFAVRVEMIESESLTISILNQLGQKILERQIENTSGGTYHFDLTNENAGVYIVRLQSASGNSSRRVLVVDQ
jgi:hypothetical protein